MQSKIKYVNKRKRKKVTSAQALGRTKRPIRPASLALNTFSNNGTTGEFKLEQNVKDDKR